MYTIGNVLDQVRRLFAVDPQPAREAAARECRQCHRFIRPNDEAVRDKVRGGPYHADCYEALIVEATM